MEGFVFRFGEVASFGIFLILLLWAFRLYGIMNKIKFILVINLLLFFAPLGNVFVLADNKDISKSLRVIDKQEVDLSNFNNLDKRLSLLEAKIVENDQFYKDILESQRQNYSMNITVFIALTTIMMGLTGLINFSIIKRELRADVRKMRAEIVQEYIDHVDKVAGKLETEINAKFNEFKSTVTKKITELTGDNFNALGRMYKGNGQHTIAAIWFARAVKEYNQCNTDYDWIKIHLNFLKNSLQAADEIGDSKRIAEFFEIFSSLDEKFKSEKEELQKLLDSKIKPLEKDSSSNQI